VMRLNQEPERGPLARPPVSGPGGPVRYHLPRPDHAARRQRAEVIVETRVPPSMQLEHEELHAELASAMKAGGRTGEAARAVMHALRPHMAREEELVIPALALLAPLAAGGVTEDMAPLLPRVTALKEYLPHMLADHRRIVETLRDLMKAAIEEKNQSFARFAQKMILHAQSEEEILYPAAILVGEYLKAKLAKP
jgi:hypothetical protein